MHVWGWVKHTIHSSHPTNRERLNAAIQSAWSTWLNGPYKRPWVHIHNDAPSHTRVRLAWRMTQGRVKLHRSGPTNHHQALVIAPCRVRSQSDGERVTLLLATG